jgi:exopolysaccharide biosynthesis polyprenyl glycosylphosphotransferase
MSITYHRLLSWLTMLTDVPLINLAFAMAYVLRYEFQWFKSVDESYYISYDAYVPIALGLTVISLIVFRLEGAYSLQARNKGWLDDVYIILNGITTGIMVIVFITFFLRPLYYSRLIFFYAALLIIIVLSLARLVRTVILGWLRQRGVGVDRVIIVGAGEVGRTVIANLVAQPMIGYKVVGFVDDNPDKGNLDMGPIRALGSIDNLPRLISELEVDEVIVTLPWMSHRKIMSILTQCERENVRARIVPDLFQMRLSQVDIEDLNGIPLLGMRDQTISGLDLFMKRTIDLVAAIAGFLVFSPLLVAICIAIKLDSPGPIIFRQVRIGKNGREFDMYKFRSMQKDAEEKLADLESQNEAQGPLFKMREDPRRTRVGKWLRKFSLDELPQLYNVLRGEMSLVGPRPHLPGEISQYHPWHRKRLDVAPGLTGLPQVSGRSNLSFDETAFLDLYYIQNWSLFLDISILLRTIPRVLFGDGAF